MTTQRQQIIDYLHKFGSITRIQAAADLGVMELASRIGELEREGYQFSKITETAINRLNKKVTFTKYTLKEEPANEQL